MYCTMYCELSGYIIYLFVCGKLALFRAAGFEITPLRGCFWNCALVPKGYRGSIVSFRHTEQGHFALLFWKYENPVSL